MEKDPNSGHESRHKGENVQEHIERPARSDVESWLNPGFETKKIPDDVAVAVLPAFDSGPPLLTRACSDEEPDPAYLEGAAAIPAGTLICTVTSDVEAHRFPFIEPDNPADPWTMAAWNEWWEELRPYLSNRGLGFCRAEPGTRQQPVPRVVVWDTHSAVVSLDRLIPRHRYVDWEMLVKLRWPEGDDRTRLILTARNWILSAVADYLEAAAKGANADHLHWHRMDAIGAPLPDLGKGDGHA